MVNDRDSHWVGHFRGQQETSLGRSHYKSTKAKHHWVGRCPIQQLEASPSRSLSWSATGNITGQVTVVVSNRKPHWASHCRGQQQETSLGRSLSWSATGNLTGQVTVVVSNRKISGQVTVVVSNRKHHRAGHCRGHCTAGNSTQETAHRIQN